MSVMKAITVYINNLLTCDPTCSGWSFWHAKHVQHDLPFGLVFANLDKSCVFLSNILKLPKNMINWQEGSGSEYKLSQVDLNDGNIMKYTN